MGNTEANHNTLRQLALDWEANKGDKATRAPIFAKLIREAISVVGESRWNLTDDLEVSASTLSRWAGGEASPHRLVQSRVVERITILCGACVLGDDGRLISQEVT